MTEFNISADISNMVESMSGEIHKIIAKELLENLKSSLASSQAQKSAEMINAKFKKEGLKDEQGNPIEVEVPSLKGVQLDENNEADISFSLNEDKFLRADKIYGKRVIDGTGFTYNNA